MLDFAGSILLGGAVAVVVTAAAVTLDLSLPARLLFAGCAGAWLGLVIAITVALHNSAPIALFFVPLIIVGALAAASKDLRARLLRLPASVLIATNVLRVLGVLFLLLLLAGRLSGPFPYSAGIGDIITGLGALPIARLVARGSLRDSRVIAWNAFGLADLLAAVTLGVLSGNGSPIQIIHAGPGSTAITTLPWAVIPLMLVPLFIIGHIIVFAQIRAAGRQEAAIAPRAPFAATPIS